MNSLQELMGANAVSGSYIPFLLFMILFLAATVSLMFGIQKMFRK